MKKILMFVMLSVGLFAGELTPTDENVLGTAGDYTFVCNLDTNKVMAISPDDVNYKVIWFNPVTNEDSWLDCKDFDVYSNVYTPSK